MSSKKTLGAVALFGGGFVFSFGLFGGQVVSCWKSGCTSYFQAPQEIADVALLFVAGGLAVMAFGIFILVSNHEIPKQRFDGDKPGFF